MSVPTEDTGMFVLELVLNSVSCFRSIYVRYVYSQTILMHTHACTFFFF
jgi:hypothetical protein